MRGSAVLRGKNKQKSCKSNTDSIGSEQKLWAIMISACFILSFSEGAGNTLAAQCYTATHSAMMLKETPKYLDGIKIFV